jgi:SAM-dependent methyltransferase
LDPYESIGQGYAERRRADPRLERAIAVALGGARSAVNVGAGTGSYEPRVLSLVGVEPAVSMIAQRPAGAAPCVRGHAETLPFGDRAFDAGLAVLTIHHWSDWRMGLRELARVARQRIVLLTWDPNSDGFWLVTDYLPAMLVADRRRFPDLDGLRDVLGDLSVQRVPIPHDCTDGFLGAYWRRPEAYLDPSIRRGISSFAREDFAEGIARLAADLDSGAWARKHECLLRRTELDIGYRLVVAEAPQPGPRTPSHGSRHRRTG